MTSKRLSQIQWINNLIFWLNNVLVFIKKNPLAFLLVFWTSNFLYDLITTAQTNQGIQDPNLAVIHFLLGTPFILVLFFFVFPSFVDRGRISRPWAFAIVIAMILAFLAIKHLIHQKLGLAPVLTDMDQLIIEQSRLLTFFAFSLVVWLFFEFILARAYNKQISLLLAKTQISHDYLSLNPHMLFNSLNNIVGKSALYSEELYHQIVSFASLLKQAYKDPSSPHTIYEELNILTNLLQLVKTAGKKTFILFTVRNFEQLEFYQIPRLVLATLLDNVFKHGLYKKKGSPAEVRLLLVPDKNQNVSLIFTTYNRINPMRNPRSSGHGIKSLLNVLKHQFGDHAFFEYEKCDDEYSTLLIISYGTFKNSTD